MIDTALCVAVSLQNMHIPFLEFLLPFSLPVTEASSRSWILERNNNGDITTVIIERIVYSGTSRLLDT